MPMRREKKGCPFGVLELAEMPLAEEPNVCPANSKKAASCRKKSRVSGKKSEKRLVLICRSSSGVSEKSVFSVNRPVSEGVIL